ncbi:MAG: hypothetical protein GY953_50210, partial [bacterium]|nr:hypothetical protein [bacterium]
MNPVFTRRGVLRAAAGALAVPGRARSATPFSLRIMDEGSGDRIPARVLVRDSLGADHVPEGAVVVPVGPDRWFVSSGVDQLSLAPGEYRLRVERGTEFVPVKRTVDVSGTSTEAHVRLRRWVDMRRRGYRSGENHLHVPARDLPGMLAAEDLDFGSSLYWWNGPRLEHPGGAEAVRQMRFGGVEAAASVFDAELEYAWGAVYLVGLRAPLETPSEKGRANWAYIAEARKLGGLVCYQGGWSREVLVDALLGLVDVVNVCNNNFHRYKFQPRSIYSNLLEVSGFPEYPDTPEGMMRMNTDTYYRLLNCGLR